MAQKKAELKTQKTAVPVADFIADIADETTRMDCETLVKWMQAATKTEPKMWGPAIVGFGDMTYIYETGRQGDWFLCGFAPRKGKLTLYIMPGFDKYPELMQKLGKHSTGKSCLYIKTLADVDHTTLKKLIKQGIADTKKIAKTMSEKIKSDQC
jgi:uncharacterized protein YdhG (YjbR/CyaY superfamily)